MTNMHVRGELCGRVLKLIIKSIFNSIDKIKN